VEAFHGSFPLIEFFSAQKPSGEIVFPDGVRLFLAGEIIAKFVM
jgi:hypothetical protein